MMCSMSGYCTFTATSRPPTSRALVHLRERRGGDRRGRELAENLAERPTEVLFDHLLHRREVARRQTVVALRQRFDVLRRKDVGTGADDLAHLHQHAAHRHRCIEDLVGVALMDRIHVALRWVAAQQPVPPLRRFVAHPHARGGPADARVPVQTLRDASGDVQAAVSRTSSASSSGCGNAQPESRSSNRFATTDAR